MANGNSKILTAEQEMKLRQPIEDYVSKIQAEIDGLRADGTDKVLSLQNQITEQKEIAPLQKRIGKRGLQRQEQSLKRHRKLKKRTKTRYQS